MIVSNPVSECRESREWPKLTTVISLGFYSISLIRNTINRRCTNLTTYNVFHLTNILYKNNEGVQLNMKSSVLRRFTEVQFNGWTSCVHYSRFLGGSIFIFKNVTFCCSIACADCVSVCMVSLVTFCGRKLLRTLPYPYIHIHATRLSHRGYLDLTILSILGEFCKLRSFSLRSFCNDGICSRQ